MPNACSHVPRSVRFQSSLPSKSKQYMPAEPKLSQKYYQEMAPKVAMDRAAIVGLRAVVKTPAGEFKDCVRVEETTPLEPGVREYKYYARGVGLVQDGSLKLVKRP